MIPPTKQALKTQLTELLQATLQTLEAAHAAAREGATHEEAKPENDKDTRALEQSYLARGQALRIAELKAGLSLLGTMSVADTEVARPGALLDVEDETGRTLRFFLAPEGGGTKLSGEIQVVTPASPVGGALMGKRSGDEIELKLAGKSRQFSVLRVV